MSKWTSKRKFMDACFGGMFYFWEAEKLWAVIKAAEALVRANNLGVEDDRNEAVAEVILATMALQEARDE